MDDAAIAERPHIGIGAPVRRWEDARLLRGLGRYVDDLGIPGQAHMVVLRSPHAAARILAIDTAPARAAPGVLAVLTGADLVADGIGWLLGDDGSGFWVGREAVRHTVRPSRGIPEDALSRSVTALLLGRPGARHEVVHHVYAGSPLRLATLTRVVVEAAEVGDPDACRILDDAAALLERSTSAVRDPGLETPIVLSGGMFASAYLLGSLSTRLRQHWPGAPIHRATNGAGGAAWLAALALDPAAPTSLHTALTRD